jgi:hypothetical protein
MYVRTLIHANQRRSFSIWKSSGGWEICDKQDDRILRRSSYMDWHRVERAKLMFAVEAARLARVGWSDYSTNR